MKETIQQFISTELLEEEELIEVDENLLADGMVDSLGMLRLIAFIDEKFDIVIPPEDFVINHFRTLNDLMAYLESRVNEG